MQRIVENFIVKIRKLGTMISRIVFAQNWSGSKEFRLASRAAFAAKAASKEGSKSAAAPAPAPAAVTPAAAPVAKTRTKMTTATKENPLFRPYPVSPILRDFLGGVAETTRSNSVKQIWAYIKEHQLQDPANKTTINCDDKLKEVFGKDQVRFTEISGLLSRHFPKKQVNK